MKLGIRSKLFIVSVLLIGLGVGAAGLILVSELRADLEKRVERQLRSLAKTGKTALRRHAGPMSSSELDALAVELGKASGARLTIIGGDGRVRGDSEVEAAELDELDNHGARPEIVGAVAHGEAIARRYSKTVRADMLYVAVGLEIEGAPWVVRAARPLSEVDASVATLRHRLLVAALIGLLIAAFMSALASHWMTRVIRELATTARAMSARRSDGAQEDELGVLAGSLGHASSQIESTLAQLDDERAKLNTILESMGEGVIALDADGLVRLVNPAAKKLLALRESTPGSPISEMIRAPALVTLVDDVPAEGGSVEFELDDGKRLLARATLPAKGSGVIVVLHDITELHRLETVRRDFVANVSHELRTPVSIISANAETLIDGGADTEASAASALLSAIQRNAQRMAKLVADLLDLSRLEAGRYELDVQPHSLGAIAKRVVELSATAAQARHTELTVDIADDIEVLADSAALEQVVTNLLENAIKYTQEGGRVTLTAKASDRVVRVEVTDDGPGIAPSERRRVFERFYRLDAGRSRDAGGTGLGLAIVRHLVSAMAGKSGVVSGPSGLGSSFWFELPAVPQDAADPA